MEHRDENEFVHDHHSSAPLRTSALRQKRSFPQIPKLTLFSNASMSDTGGRAKVKVIARRPCVVGEVEERSNHLAQFQM
jgi:hypothetical protein